MQGHAASEGALATAPSSPTRRLCCGQDVVDCAEDDDTGGIHFFFSAPASPVHYILRSPPASSSSSAASVHHAEGDGCAGDFEFASARHRVAGTGMSSAEDLFLSGRIRVGGLSPIRQETGHGEEEDGDDGGGHSRRPRRARSASPPRTPRFAENGSAETPSESFASSSASSAKTIRRRISLRDLLGRTCSSDFSSSAGPALASAINSGADAEIRSSFWLPSIWPSRTKKGPLLPCPCPAPPHPGRRSTSSVRAAPGGGGGHGRQREGAPPRRTTYLPYRQGLVLGCLGLGARSYGLANSMHPLSTR
ncbi:uncharacterized protein LOC100834894 [Brachypodium distachyon]|uniref:Uncharacterized protein n=1 Tax=Brachypodium distachyon TaxID=15368 RepID=I1HDZ5_BRADI|nr:uncharacterized protein LOC100834894 [Brachypodium distachyon]KQK03633.1 hypothetical protein BRADI_2g09020v3 [Brachypodium distachyon]|eukprot:XP_003565594.1 uncharacterized protein LOC100834894 [Brachypodium distachyon]